MSPVRFLVILVTLDRRPTPPHRDIQTKACDLRCSASKGTVMASTALMPFTLPCSKASVIAAYEEQPGDGADAPGCISCTDYEVTSSM